MILASTSSVFLLTQESPPYPVPHHASFSLVTINHPKDTSNLCSVLFVCALSSA